MQYKDQLGLDYTASSEDSITLFETFAGQYLASNKEAMPSLEKLIEFDATLPMAHCLRAYMLKMSGDPKFARAIASSMDILAKLESSMNTREKMHYKTIQTWVNNQYTDTATILEELLQIFPKDILALRIAHYLHFYEGDNKRMCTSIARSNAVWHISDPCYGYVLGMQSFAFEESGEYAQAEAIGRQAVEINKEDIWGAHAVAHVFQMQGRKTEGTAWLGELLNSWQDANNFVYHMHWHKALFHIGAGELDQSLAIYDEHLVECLNDDFYLDVCNAAALLWRLDMLGQDVTDRWRRLRAYSKKRIKDDELVFSTLHYLMTPAVLNDKETTDEAIKHFEAWSLKDTSQGAVCKRVGLPLARSIVEIGQGKYKEATNRLADIKDEIYRIGGSHAQRHLFDDLFKHYKQAF
ncbi:MAG: tetratricopeptide repeat protein [Pseudomonadales bacterium]|jgi:tetratricopeptide (TPR) repeat protein